ncbi:hypothetical protein PHYSODRAFT_484231 [Phytophthora sojae]|uniref:Uncharacterized protein n=1 Tax=Phytophthora sojae (strain P6497) TaxID=1094619 RepID=G4YRT6_PHYSP|nr:hypothetical protein PHYSODRAFT_484231 [Phytophthora sojae]EGZ22913.1 hypothetical protein PHYSODRAFT_484231 [Phytophthora sojae]|eukprot:XP_009518201.1 hypothetical protein PHYSODRAFT_484231 [Phytophthora sojae]
MSHLIKPITSDHDLIELAEKMNVQLDNIFASNEIKSHLSKKGSFLILTDAVDAGEKFLLSKATKPEHEDLIRSVRKEVRRRYGVGVAKKRPAKGSPEMKERMAKLRAMRKKGKSGGSFTL